MGSAHWILARNLIYIVGRWVCVIVKTNTKDMSNSNHLKLECVLSAAKQN